MLALAARSKPRAREPLPPTDWADESYRGDLGRLVARTAYNTRHRVLKTTKTRVEKWLPVHPALAAVLKTWKAEGWQRFWGRDPQPADLIVPSATGKPRSRGARSATTS